MKKSAILFLLVCISGKLLAQGTFSGDLMMNLNFFQTDAKIGASNNPLYNNLLNGDEAWLGLRYSVSGFNFYVRADAFDNSNLKNPASAMTGFGIGAWSVNKEVEGLNITIGSIYDQIGSGILFRAYENRGLLIDNALMGVELKYKIGKNIVLKGFVGEQKNNDPKPENTPSVALYQLYEPVIKGFNAEGDYSIGKVHILPGLGIVNRTLDQTSMTQIAGTINDQPLNTRFNPMYNMYAFSAYNTLVYKNFSWYAEGDYKTHEAINEPDAAGNELLVNKPGNVEYTSLTYGKKGIALSLQGKRTEDFVMRVSPNPPPTPLDEYLDWEPIIATLRPERLMSRYTPISEDISEMAGTASLTLSPNDLTNINLTYSNINTLQNATLYREYYADVFRQWTSWILQGGAQYMEFNIQQYESEGSAQHPIVYAFTPFVEATYRINEKKSIRAEVQYQDTKQDYGSWVYVLLEYNIAPRWSLSASDMYNVVPNPNSDNHDYHNPGLNYPDIYVAYGKGPHRFSLAYVKQVDGINCSGGVCRYEPAFSGFRATLTSSF
jgi:hypothetical protein